MIERIDQWLREVGTQSLVDGDKVRDMLLDLRIMAAREETNEADLRGEESYSTLAG